MSFYFVILFSAVWWGGTGGGGFGGNLFISTTYRILLGWWLLCDGGPDDGGSCSATRQTQLMKPAATQPWNLAGFFNTCVPNTILHRCITAFVASLMNDLAQPFPAAAPVPSNESIVNRIHLPTQPPRVIRLISAISYVLLHATMQTMRAHRPLICCTMAF
jgi:hypothetical protein